MPAFQEKGYLVMLVFMDSARLKGKDGRTPLRYRLRCSSTVLYDVRELSLKNRFCAVDLHVWDDCILAP